MTNFDDWTDDEFDQAEAAGDLPEAHTLKEEMPEVYDEQWEQWGHGTCTAQAVAGCIAHRTHKNTGTWLSLSRSHIFYIGREKLYGPGDLCNHKDAWLPWVLEAVRTKGACGEEVWPFDGRMLLEHNLCPLPGAVENAPKVRIEGYWDMSNETPFANPGRIEEVPLKKLQGKSYSWDMSNETSIDEVHLEELQRRMMKLQRRIMRCILTGCPAMFVIQLYDNFAPQGEDDEIPLPKWDSPKWIQHAMIIYGYDLNQGEHGMYKVQNSWGADWGYEGKCRIPMEYINLEGRDFCSLRRAP